MSRQPFQEGPFNLRARQWAEKLASRPDVPHVVLGMETGDGSYRQVFALGQALPDGTAMKEDTPFFIASVTKLYIAAAVLRLTEEKEVDLDAPLSRYFPPGYLKGLHVYQGKECTDALTPRHLLAHASGLPDWLEDRPKGGKSLVETVVEEEEDRYYSAEDLIDHVRTNLSPLFPPQDLNRPKPRVRYSDTNFQLLIRLVEGVRGGPIAGVFEEMFFRPLGLKNTFFPVFIAPTGQARNGRGSPFGPQGKPEGGGVGAEREEKRDGLPSVFWAGRQPFAKRRVIASTRDLYSTAQDSIAFLKALTRGTLFNRPETFPRMTAPWNRFGFPASTADLRLPGYPIQYGLGIMRFELPRLFTPFKRVPPVLGHTGSTGSWLFYCPERDLYLAGTVDQVTAGAVPFRLMARLLY